MKTFQDFLHIMDFNGNQMVQGLHIMDFNGNQMVQGPKDTFSATSKGFKQHKTMNKGLGWHWGWVNFQQKFF